MIISMSSSDKVRSKKTKLMTKMSPLKINKIERHSKKFKITREKQAIKTASAYRFFLTIKNDNMTDITVTIHLYVVIGTELCGSLNQINISTNPENKLVNKQELEN